MILYYKKLGVFVSIGLLSVIVIQCFMFAAIYVLWIRLSRAPEDDPRLTKGLQLLQSKIAVLEDLSDRTETQVNQLTALMENKIKEIQIKIIDADKVINHIELKIQKSMEVAKIFQDKIPHQEILDRQYTIKYVRAAKLAHQGMSTDDIAKEVDLTPAEIELILKLNKEQLMFSEEELPDWAADQERRDVPSERVQNSQWIDFEKAFEVPKVDQQNLKKLGAQFKEALAAHGTTSNVTANTTTTPVASVSVGSVKAEIKSDDIDLIKNKLMNFGSQLMAGSNQEKAPEKTSSEALNQKGKVVSVKPFEFKRIETDSFI